MCGRHQRVPLEVHQALVMTAVSAMPRRDLEDERMEVPGTSSVIHFRHRPLLDRLLDFDAIPRILGCARRWTRHGAASGQGVAVDTLHREGVMGGEDTDREVHPRQALTIVAGDLRDEEVCL